LLRGGHAAAAAALDRAAELSTDPEAKARRLVHAAGAAWQAGQPERATNMLDRVGPISGDPELHSDLIALRGVIEWRCGSLPDACAMLLEAASEIAQADPGRALELLGDAGLAAWGSGFYERLGGIEDALDARPRLRDDADVCMAEVLSHAIRMSLGTPAGELPGMTETLSRATAFDDPRLLIWAAIAAELAGEDALETTLLNRAASLARASGAVD